MRSFLILLGFIVISGCTTLNTSLRGNSAQHLCSIAPSLNICVDPPEELTASGLKQRMDKEYAYQKEAGQIFSREYAANAFGFVGFKKVLPEYIYLRDRTQREANQTSNETGQQYFQLVTIGHIAHRAGDIETAIASIHSRRKLIRNRPEGQEWTQRYADVGWSTPRQQAWVATAISAAQFGDPKFAIDILHEATPESDREEYSYHLNLAKIYLAAGQFSESEDAAQKSVELYPSRWPVDDYPNDLITALIYVIESMAAQNKPYQVPLKNLRKQITRIHTYLSGHAFHFFVLSQRLSSFAHDGAVEFLSAGQSIYSVDNGGDQYPFRHAEVDACAALKNLQCLMDIAMAQEAALGENDEYLFDTVARTYILGRDYHSAKRLLDQVSEGCGEFAYTLALTQLIEEKNFVIANDWLDRQIKCQSTRQPNFQTHFGEGGTLWKWVVVDYVNLSREQLEAGYLRDALTSAKTAYLLMLEAERSWSIDSNSYRATDFGQMHGAVYGALVMAERAQ